MNSRLYQLDSQPTPQNAGDNRFYSHFKVKRISAEPLLDAIDYATGSPTKYPEPAAGDAGHRTARCELPEPVSGDVRQAQAGQRLRMRADARRKPGPGAAHAERRRAGDQDRRRQTAASPSCWRPRSRTKKS